MSAQEINLALLLVIRALEECGASYKICGSVAGTLLGAPRATSNADLVADLPAARAARFVELLGAGFYADAESIARSIERKRSFNVIHLGTMLKVDVFPVKDSPYARQEFTRRLKIEMPGEPESVVFVTTPEDLVLNKLLWYRAGGQVSDRQWRDVVTLLRVHSGRLDEAYLEKWSGALDIGELLARARAGAKA